MSTMTLEQVRDWHLAHTNYVHLPITNRAHKDMADAIDAHLAQPAQAVDVGALSVLAGRWNGNGTNPAFKGPVQATYRAAADELQSVITRALSGEKAGPVGDGWQPPDGFAVALLNATEAYERTRDQFNGKHRKTHAAQVRLLRKAFAELLPASPTPGKETP